MSRKLELFFEAFHQSPIKLSNFPLHLKFHLRHVGFSVFEKRYCETETPYKIFDIISNLSKRRAAVFLSYIIAAIFFKSHLLSKSKKSLNQTCDYS